MSAARFIVTGRVQGVAFRAHARDEAMSRGLTGHARNRDDGSVDVQVHGDPAAIDAFAAWLAQGPELARVDGVQRLVAEAGEAPANFTIG
jgi:acylphosphatase